MAEPTQLKEKVSLNDGLPKRNAHDIISELKDVLYSENNMEKFFPEERMQRIQANFNLFGINFFLSFFDYFQFPSKDRDNDEHINLSELKELLISINQMIPEDELEELYHELKLNTERPGINIDLLKVLVSKRIRDEDKEEQLNEAFKQVVKEQKQQQQSNEEIDSEQFKEMLQTMGLRWTEEQAEEFLKDADPKGDGKFNFSEFIKKILKR